MTVYTGELKQKTYNVGHFQSAVFAKLKKLYSARCCLGEVVMTV